MIDLTIMTIIVYLLANSFTYYRSNCNEKPLNDFMHDILPNWAKYVHIRDVILLLFFLPVLLIKNKFQFALEVWEIFMIVVALKSICIVFTQVPSSFPYCHDIQYINHCFHQSISAHASLCLILAFMYKEYGIVNNYVYLFVVLYCLLILCVRAHFSIDIIQGITISWLLCLTKT